ncbi:MAG: glutamate-1-semialdehyde 2,1-aminomutase, partial [Thermoplasmata archaeon]
KIFDVEDHAYIDYCLGFGPLILGHSSEKVKEAVNRQIEDGTLFGTPSESEILLAKKIKESSRSIKMMRFTNSGTEATMHAIRLARAYTKRDIIVKMEGGFHGAHDYSLINSGSGTLTFGRPSSPGIPETVSETVIAGKYNDQDSISYIFKKYGDRIAAVITEPVMGNAGVILPKPGFLEFLREITQDNSSLLIFDEVITGYRYAFSPYQDIVGIEPDITTLGKIIGGGLPIGLFGGSREIMSMVSPSGSVYESGTFSGNPLTMAAGLAAMNELQKSDYRSLAKVTKDLVDGIIMSAEKRKKKLTVNSIGSMFQMFFGVDHVEDYNDALKADKNAYFRAFRMLTKEGVYLPPSQYETNFVSFAHTESDVSKTLKAIDVTLERMM